jgi:NAD(P)-dependent dehydrogenase (short-subunit alcohol dehydrogenase family)
MIDFAGRVAVVTGASTGIGRATAEALAELGARVVLAARDPDRLAAAMQGIGRPRDQVAGFPADLAEAAQVHALADFTLDTFGAVHVLVNNAGVFAPGYAWDIPLSEWEWVMRVNLWAPVLASRALLPHILAAGEGHIVNVASVGGLLGAAAQSPYVTSKHALVGFSKALRDDLALKGSAVGVTCVCPGAVATSITTQLQTGGPDGLPRDVDRYPPEVRSVVESFAAYTDQGVDPVMVAGQIIEAIRAGTFWLIPNGAPFMKGIRREAAAVEAGIA